MNRQYVGARYVPVFADPIEWNNQKVYEPLTIVTYMGSSYTSRKRVPAGVLPTDNKYWACTGNYNAQVEEYRQTVVKYSEAVENLNKRNPSVKDFGAVGDGVTNDLPAFVAWLDYLIENEVHGIIPDGVYILNGILSPTLSDDVIATKSWGFAGETKQTTLKFTTDTVYINASNWHNVVARNFTVVGTGNFNAERGTAIWGSNISDTVFEDIELTNISVCGVNIFRNEFDVGNNNVVFNRVNIHGVPHATYPFPSGYIIADTSNSMVSNCYIENLRWYGVEYKTGCTHCNANNVIAKDCGSVCHISGNGETGNMETYDIHYDNVTCYNCGYAVYAGYAYNCSVCGLTVFQNGEYTNPYNIVFGLRIESMKRMTVEVENCKLLGSISPIFIVSNIETYPATLNTIVFKNLDDENRTARGYVIDASSGATLSTKNVLICVNRGSLTFLLTEELTGDNTVIDVISNTRIK